MGHLLLPELRKQGHRVVALDIKPLSPELAAHCSEFVEASILDTERLADLVRRHRPEQVFHLAAVLSTRAEQDPTLAHAVNVDGTVELMSLCANELGAAGRPPRFLYPSSIAVYGMPDARTKDSAGAVKEPEWNVPTGMYGCNKLYCEQLGAYYSRHYKQLAESPPKRWVDFRAIRFPGLISAVTIPTGGTSDYAPEMIHAAARGERYDSFVRPDTRIPFMAMPDAVEALVQLAEAPLERLTQHVYSITAFNPSADEVRELVLEAFPDADIGFQVDGSRQAVVDTWPADVDDSAARADWGFAPRYDLHGAFDEYLIPTIRERYRNAAPAL